ncbi:MAG: hypothetical protein C4583_11755 [Anaerolineaceae bacterium]|nr:MAG: hypothetical protein C4583_11755 [Anaerolineaceae bacterium]
MENNTQTKPSLIMVIALMTLVNGIFNIIWGIAIIVGTVGLSLLCFPVPLFPIVLGGFEIAYAIKLLATPPQPAQPSQAIAIWEIVAIFVGNVFSLIVGILALIFYNDVTVRDYFAQLNGTQTPPPTPAAPVPALPVDPTPEPPAPAPVEPETPEKPKRRPRKVA